MRRLVWAHAGRTYHIVGNLMSWLIMIILAITHEILVLIAHAKSLLWNDHDDVSSGSLSSNIWSKSSSTAIIYVCELNECSTNLRISVDSPEPALIGNAISTKNLMCSWYNPDWSVLPSSLITPGRRQSKTSILSTNVDKNRKTGDKWQSKTLFLAIFDPRLSIVKSVFDCRVPGVLMQNKTLMSAISSWLGESHYLHCSKYLKEHYVFYPWSQYKCTHSPTYREKDHWRFGPYTPIFLIPRTLLLSFLCGVCSISEIGESNGKSQLAKYFQNFYTLGSYGG